MPEEEERTNACLREHVNLDGKKRERESKKKTKERKGVVDGFTRLKGEKGV